MINEELENKANQYVVKSCKTPENVSLFGEILKRTYLTAVEENCKTDIVWHDLRKNPKDLPKDKEFKITDKGDIGFYDSLCEKWYYWNSNEMIFPPIAWCEIPEFEK